MLALDGLGDDGDLGVVEELAEGDSVVDVGSVEAVSVAVLSLFRVGDGSVRLAAAGVGRQLETSAGIDGAGSAANSAGVWDLTGDEAGVDVVANAVGVGVGGASAAAVVEDVADVEVAVAVDGGVKSSDPRGELAADAAGVAVAARDVCRVVEVAGLLVGAEVLPEVVAEAVEVGIRDAEAGAGVSGRGVGANSVCRGSGDVVAGRDVGAVVDGIAYAVEVGVALQDGSGAVGGSGAGCAAGGEDAGGVVAGGGGVVVAGGGVAAAEDFVEVADAVAVGVGAAGLRGVCGVVADGDVGAEVAAVADAVAVGVRQDDGSGAVGGVSGTGLAGGRGKAAEGGVVVGGSGVVVAGGGGGAAEDFVGVADAVGIGIRQAGGICRVEDRVVVAGGDVGAVVSGVAEAVGVGVGGVSVDEAVVVGVKAGDACAAVVEELAGGRGRGVVVAGSSVRAEVRGVADSVAIGVGGVSVDEAVVVRVQAGDACGAVVEELAGGGGGCAEVAGEGVRAEVGGVVADAVVVGVHAGSAADAPGVLVLAVEGRAGDPARSDPVAEVGVEEAGLGGRGAVVAGERIVAADHFERVADAVVVAVVVGVAADGVGGADAEQDSHGI